MKKTSWKHRLLVWYARRVYKVPFIVDFTPEWMDDVFAVGFAWSPEAANRMRGDDRLIERARAAEAAASMARNSRSARRMANRAARKAAKKELGRG